MYNKTNLWPQLHLLHSAVLLPSICHSNSFLSTYLNWLCK